MSIAELLANEDLRKLEFPVTRDKVFLAHAGVCPLPRRVSETIAEYARTAATGDQEKFVYPAILEEGRKLGARLLNCQPDEIALVGPTSLGLSLIASGVKFRKGDNILIYFEDYPSNVYPWMALAGQGVEVRLMNTRGLGAIRPADVMGQVDENTRLVALASCHFVSGYRIDYQAIGKYLRERGILFCLDGIQTSGAVFAIEDPESIRFGLTAVKNVGEGAVEVILQARQAGPFKSLDDFCARVDLRGVNKKVIESLIKAGAMDSLDSTGVVGAVRGKLLAAAGDAVDRQQQVQADISRGQGLLFGLGELPAAPAETATAVPALHEHDVLAFEKEVLGFYFSGHPLLSVKELLRVAASHEIVQLTAEITKPVRLAGMISQVKRMVTKEEGKQWAKCIFEDLSGEISLLVFPKRYADGLGNQLKVGAIVAVEGRLSFRGDVGDAAGAGAPELVVQDILPLETAASRNARRLRLSCDPEALGDVALEELREILERSPGPCPVILEHETPEGTAILELDACVMVDKNLLESIVKILGEKTWRIESAS